MNKPNNYDNTQANTGDFVPVELGGHYAIIRKAEERLSSTGKMMVVVEIDFDQKDTQPGYFQESYDRSDKEPKKWPYQGTQYIVTEDNEGNCSRSFKSFCTSYEDSNKTPISWNGGNDWAKQFTDKKIGVVFREVEEEYNGEVRTRRRIAWFCDYNKALDQNTPRKKELQKGSSADPEEFMKVPSDDIPW